MAQPLSKGTFAPIRRVINDDYKPADESYPMGGTVVPSVITEDPENSGVRFPVHAEKLTGTNLVIEKDGEMKTIRVSPRAMEILRSGNRDGKRMNYEEAIKMAAAQEEAEKKASDEKKAKEEAAAQDAVNKLPPVEPPLVREGMTIGVDLARSPDFSAAHIGINSNVAEPEYMKAQRAGKPEKKGKRGKVVAPVASVPTAKIPVSFSSSLGAMAIMAERVFIGGPGGICLVIIQYSPEGHFYVPPQVDEPITISFQGQVYKCLTGIYYQIPGTPVMHTVYFISKE
jgi:hypothetical protein